MQAAIDLRNAPVYVWRLRALGFPTLLAAGGIVIFVAMHAAGQGPQAAPGDQRPPWGLIIAVWRDSFVVSLLFFAEDFVRQTIEFFGLDDLALNPAAASTSVVAPIALFALQLFGVVIILRRIFILSRWLRALR